MKDFEFFCSKLSSAISRRSEGQNVFFSPSSIALVMSMCTAGARHATLEQMLQVFGVSSKDELVNIAERCMQTFTKANQAQQLTRSDSFGRIGFTPVQLHLVNRLYAQVGYRTKQKYLDLLSKSFQSTIEEEDFINNGPQVVQRINTWIQQQTNDRISNMLSTNDIKNDTLFLIVNCIYFKAEWESKFKETNTNKHAEFYESNGMKSEVALMNRRGYYLYADHQELAVQIAHLPYKVLDGSSRFIFTVILPYKGVSLDYVEQQLSTNPRLQQSLLNIQQLEGIELDLYIPKFHLETKYELGDTLKSMGMTDAFDRTVADFKGIIGTVSDINRIWIAKVIHKTFITVNEEGTEAAAATAAKMALLGASMQRKQPVEFKANRPFLFFIHEAEQQVLLFSGKFVSPPNAHN